MANSRKSSSSELTGLVAAQLAAHLPRGTRLTLGLSGGVDSVVLLDVLAARAGLHPFELRCLHVHHGLSPNADLWAEFCADLAARYGTPLDVMRVNVAAHRGLGHEGAARAARYEAFAHCTADFVALAHHRDDQAETLLLNLMRGSGALGLAGMRPLRRMASAPALLRPLLAVGRRELEAYARARGLAWIEDESNTDAHLARNYLRHTIMPLLARINPAAAANVARSATHLREAQEVLDAVAVEDLVRCDRGGRIGIAALQALGYARAKNALRMFCRRAAPPAPASAELDEMLAQITGARDDAAVRLAVGGSVLRRFRGELWLVAKPCAAPAVAAARWNGQSRWELPHLGGALTFEATEGRGVAAQWLQRRPVEARLRSGGERFRVDASRPRRTLKNLLQESGVPPWERTRLPLLYCEDRLVFVAGLGIDADCAAGSGEPGITIAWHPTAELSNVLK
jgi:tRNA(Ile)-lysidine synthase